MARSKFVYLRVPFQSDDWLELLDAGWQTLCVNSEGIALMIKER